MAANRAQEQVDPTTWIGREESTRDVVGPTPVAALHATLDHPAEPVAHGTPLPPLWHWLYFLPVHRQSELGRTNAVAAAEHRHEVTERSEADGETRFGDGSPIAKTRVGVRQTDVAQESMRRAPFELRENPREVEHADAGVARQRRE